MTTFLCSLAMAAGLSMWMLISPRSAWHVTSAWRYRNPEAHEPTDATYAVQRVFAGFVLVLCVVFYFVVVDAADRADSDVQEREYQECLDRHRGRDSLLSPEDWCENLSPTPDD